jgi:ketosteroid isomerase-like protein
MSRFPIAALAAATALAACSGTASAPGGHTSPASPSRTAELSPALAPIAWWLGDWVSDAGTSSEHWVAAGGAIYGIALHKQTFEVIVIDDGDGPGKPDGVLRFYAMPNGDHSVEFRQRTLGDGAATFANEAHEFPKTISYQRAADRLGLSAMLGGGGRSVAFKWKRAVHKPAPDLEAADRAFAASTAQLGVDGWVAAFDPRGGMMRKAGRVSYSAIGDAMRETLASGRLSWTPTASGASGNLGYTVGKATYTGPKAADGWRSTYVTIWRRQPDGTWKVLFDTGRIVHDA